MAEEEPKAPAAYIFYGLDSKPNSIFEPFRHCETDRFWRKSVGQLVEKFKPGKWQEIDECRNAYAPPREPKVLDLNNHLLHYTREKGVHIVNPNL